MCKYDKQTATLTDTITLTKDLPDNPYKLTVFYPRVITVDKEKIHIIVSRTFFDSLNNNQSFQISAMSLDTQMNWVMNEMVLPFPPKVLNIRQLIVDHNHNNLIAFADVQKDYSWARYSSFIRYDINGIILQSGYMPYGQNNLDQYIMDISLFKKKSFLIIGDRIPFNGGGSSGGLFYPDHAQPAVITDSQLNFATPFFIRNAAILDYVRAAFNGIAIPSGSVFVAGECNRAIDSIGPFIAKHNPDQNLERTDSICFSGLDALDKAHTRQMVFHSLAYNPKDNLLYYVSKSHVRYQGDIDCSDITNYSYLDIICVDTNLNLNWRKSIPFGYTEEANRCFMSTNFFPDLTNGGVWVAGWNRNTSDSFNNYLFYVTDTTTIRPLIIPPTTGITDKDELKEIGIYPNPAHYYLYIHSKAISDIKEVEFINVIGNIQKISFNMNSEKIKINISQIPDGIYLIRIRSKNGETVTKKVMIKH
ncbi:MAG TPA: T9SS type A sorting domain-containing protein [Edaphocola sp.]|nr:T9SS type A sorting domain-containing protein [Edaphocola sp.]